MSKGDALARGARSATFGPPKGVTASKWDAAFEDFDPKAFLAKSDPMIQTDPSVEQPPKVKVGI